MRFIIQVGTEENFPSTIECNEKEINYWIERIQNEISYSFLCLEKVENNTLYLIVDCC